jgi:large conductance mechanosensitive channel
MLKEFRQFLMRGNVIDLAIGFIMGVAFTGVVNSLVNDVIMPPIGVLLGGFDFGDYFVSLSGGDYASLAAAKAAGAATLNYGAFVNTVVNFVIVGAAAFLLVKLVNHVAPKHPAAPPAPPRQEALLEEIRDLLKTR